MNYYQIIMLLLVEQLYDKRQERNMWEKTEGEKCFSKIR